MSSEFDVLLTASKDAKLSLSNFETKYVRMPTHTSYTHALHLEHPAYGKTVRLAKRWLEAHMFGWAFSEEAIELMVASLFLKPWPFSVPASPHVGFLRFLRLLGRYNWSTEVLVVDTNGEVPAAALAATLSSMSANRDAHPAMVIATSTDPSGTVWTQMGPSKMVLRRVVKFAQFCQSEILKALQESNRDDQEESLKRMFRTSLDELVIPPLLF